MAIKGSSHTVFSAAGWAWGAPPVLVAFGVPLDLATWLVTTVTAGGAGLAPDCDHENGTIAHSFGPPTRMLAKGVKKAFGGHRRGAHSIIFCLGLGSIVSVLVGLWPTITLGITLGICGAWFGRTQRTGTQNRREIMGAAIALGAIVPLFVQIGLLLGIAVGVGALLHLLADWLMDDGGLPLFWPVIRKKYSLSKLPLIGHLALNPEKDKLDNRGNPIRKNGRYEKEGGQGERAVAWICRLAIPAAPIYWYLIHPLA